MRIEITHDPYLDMHPTSRLGPPVYSLRIDGVLQAPDTWAIEVTQNKISGVTTMTVEVPR